MWSPLTCPQDIAGNELRVQEPVWRKPFNMAVKASYAPQGAIAYRPYTTSSDEAGGGSCQACLILASSIYLHYDRCRWPRCGQSCNPSTSNEWPLSGVKKKCASPTRRAVADKTGFLRCDPTTPEQIRLSERLFANCPIRPHRRSLLQPQRMNRGLRQGLKSHEKSQKSRCLASC